MVGDERKKNRKLKSVHIYQYIYKKSRDLFLLYWI